MQPKNNNLDYIIDPAFRNISRMFLLSFKKDFNNPTRSSFDDYDMSLLHQRF